MTDRYTAYLRRRSERLRNEEAQRAFEQQQRTHAAALRDHYVQQTAWHIAEACAELSMPAHQPSHHRH